MNFKYMNFIFLFWTLIGLISPSAFSKNNANLKTTTTISNETQADHSIQNPGSPQSHFIYKGVDFSVCLEMHFAERNNCFSDKSRELEAIEIPSAENKLNPFSNSFFLNDRLKKKFWLFKFSTDYSMLTKESRVFETGQYYVWVNEIALSHLWVSGNELGLSIPYWQLFTTGHADQGLHYLGRPQIYSYFPLISKELFSLRFFLGVRPPLIQRHSKVESLDYESERFSSGEPDPEKYRITEIRVGFSGKYQLKETLRSETFLQIVYNTEYKTTGPTSSGASSDTINQRPVLLLIDETFSFGREQNTLWLAGLSFVHSINNGRRLLLLTSTETSYPQQSMLNLMAGTRIPLAPNLGLELKFFRNVIHQEAPEFQTEKYIESLNLLSTMRLNAELQYVF